jgi:serine dehydrogenase proteinase
MDPLSLLWLFFVLASLQPAFTRQFLLIQRRRALAAISREREVTVITLIHRQESRPRRSRPRWPTTWARPPLAARMQPDRAREVARLMATGVRTHDTRSRSPS